MARQEINAREEPLIDSEVTSLLILQRTQQERHVSLPADFLLAYAKSRMNARASGAMLISHSDAPRLGSTTAHTFSSAAHIFTSTLVLLRAGVSARQFPETDSFAPQKKEHSCTNIYSQTINNRYAKHFPTPNKLSQTR